MTIPEQAKSKFELFITTTYGSDWIGGVGPSELGRAMVKDRLVIIRHFDQRRTSQGLDIFCSDKDLAQELEEGFMVWLTETEGEEHG